MNTITRQQNSHSGFTLIEVMVSVTIFTIIITMGIGALLTVNSTLQKTRADRQTIDSLAYVMDTMTRQIRTGKDYERYNGGIRFSPQDEGSGTSGKIAFYPEVREGGNYKIMMENTEGVFDITPKNVEIIYWQIRESGLTNTDLLQPFVRISIKATVKNGRQQSPIAIQTIVSQRWLDFAPAVPIAPPNAG